jgi:hypothetical protein
MNSCWVTMAGSPEVKRMTPSLQHPASGNHKRIRCLASVAEDVGDPTGHTDGGAGRRQRPHLAETVPRPPLQHVEDLLVLLMHVSEGKSPPGGMADSNTPTRRLEQRLPRQCRAWLAEDPDRDQWDDCLTFAPTLEVPCELAVYLCQQHHLGQEPADRVS